MLSGSRHSPTSQTASGGRQASRVIALCLAVLLVASVAFPLVRPTPQAQALTSATITIDGQFDDWAGVRSDPDNVAVDTQLPNDPDWPGQPDRDVYYVNATYDEEYLYLCWRRTAGGVKAITFAAYIDLDGDGLLQEDRDIVVAWTVSDPTSEEPSQQNYDEQGRILGYYQARTKTGALIYPEGDPMDHYGPPPTSMQNPPDANWEDYRHDSPHGDGNTPDGWATGSPQYDEYYPAKTMDAYLDYVTGIECEARVAWSDLGFADTVASPPLMSMHFVAANGEDFGSPNKASLWPDDYKNTNGQLEESNLGQVEDNVKGLYWMRAKGLNVSPDNVGSAPEDTVVSYTHTISNSGNSTDVFDLSLTSSQGWPVWYELPDGSSPSALTLGPEESVTVVVHVTVPAGTVSGTQDVTRLTATSQSDETLTDWATDTTFVGDVTVAPDRAASVPPDTLVTYTHTLTNHQGATASYDLIATSTQGWANSILDANGDPLSAVTLDSGESTTVVVTVSVPSGVAIGTQDVTRVRATDQTNTSIFDEAEDTTTVRDGLDLSPDHSGYGGAGTNISYDHVVTNSWPTTRTISLAASSSQGWSTKIYAEDGVTEITEVTVGPYGAAEGIVVRVFVPIDATTSDVDVTTVTASTGGDTATATDTTTITQLQTFDTGGYTTPVDEFLLGDIVYARATGLGAYSNVYFVWYDDDGTLVRVSDDRRVDTAQMAFDDYTTQEVDAIGPGWTVQVFDAGDDYTTDTPIETVYFEVTYDARITLLNATDAATIGATTTVDCSTVNDNAVTIVDSTMTYVIWWDDDGDGEFSTADTYMDSTGAPQSWDGSTQVDSHVTTGITVAGGDTWDDTSWSMGNAQFPNQGTYNVTATWTDQWGNVIDIATTEFFSIPTLGWPLFLIAAIVGVALLWRRVRIPGTDVPRVVGAS